MRIDAFSVKFLNDDDDFSLVGLMQESREINVVSESNCKQDNLLGLLDCAHCLGNENKPEMSDLDNSVFNIDLLSALTIIPETAANSSNLMSSSVPLLEKTFDVSLSFLAYF